MSKRCTITGMLNTTHRKVAWEILQYVGTGHVHLEHELFRIAHTYRDGLTEKEYKYLMARCEVLKEENEKMVKLKDRLKGTLNGRH